MKKVVLLLVVVLAVWLGVNYMRTGKLTLMPAAMSEEQRHLQDLETELKGIDAKIAQAGRAAGLTGMDTTADVSALMVRKEQLQKEIAEARKQLH
jgi:hypothetical protein